MGGPLFAGQAVAAYRAGDRSRVEVPGGGQVGGAGRHAELLFEHAAHQVLGERAVGARVRRGDDRDVDAVAVLGDVHAVAVGGQGVGEHHGPFGINHEVTLMGAVGGGAAAGSGEIGIAVPDHSPKILTTMEIAALRAPATTI